MIYQGKEVEVIGKKIVFGEEIAWIKIQETGEFLQITRKYLEGAKKVESGLPMFSAD